MDVEKSFFAISRIFHAWVRVMEYHTRKNEVLDSEALGPARLIVSPPTDAGILLLAKANSGHGARLLCFSTRTEQIAQAYRKKHRIDGLTTTVEPFFRIPVLDEELSVVYANCLFDFCAEADFDRMLDEIRRALEPGGVLFAVYMDHPTRFAGRIWAWLFRRLGFLSHGCHPVSIVPSLARRGYRILKDEPADTFGFPIRYVVAKAPAPADAGEAP